MSIILNLNCVQIVLIVYTIILVWSVGPHSLEIKYFVTQIDYLFSWDSVDDSHCSRPNRHDDNLAYSMQ